MVATNGTLKADVKSLLRYGKENARTGKEMARVLGFRDDRMVRLVIRELIADGMPMASSGVGYFIATTPDEATEYMQNLKSRLVEDANRRKDFMIAARAILQPGQIPLF